MHISCIPPGPLPSEKKVVIPVSEPTTNVLYLEEPTYPLITLNASGSHKAMFKIPPGGDMINSTSRWFDICSMRLRDTQHCKKLYGIVTYFATVGLCVRKTLAMSISTRRCRGSKPPPMDVMARTPFKILASTNLPVLEVLSQSMKESVILNENSSTH